ncbi:branched-chain amino acid ABC transporter permease [Thermosulfuriphilus ammonigenes]|uniref:Branched-chain amino acid ABC transporter permease n=1 Tax=Thermosulfuriphilus ammonigenes TaxID=1936021 RepID=A0A6G7PTP3_9BACT|nr:branched-chain amino acid ABC transporter permease [Thermosulfuriphilus ammonigenes]MBA2848892.1 branched-chain amino acid transport system permease protein [Thermosulfuriphilus ammonigenes]QIJ70990.1 branched-chain amino acid ABC transporter permease [Thermosulfuriphilus ammonigenes]HFB83856.1 branched-chain amino acid ABC transporter permease [Thermodesulfatator sp.]
MSELLQYLFSGLTNGAIYALIALGFTIIFNATEVINFAQGEFVMLGAMILATLCQHTSLPLPLAFVITMAIVAAVGVMMERLTIRPARKASPLVLIIITIGVSILIKGVAMLIWGKDPLPVPAFSGEKPIFIMGATLIPQGLWVLGVGLVAVALTQWFFQGTIMGKAMRACAVSQRAASLIGINVSPLVLISFALSAATSAIAGMVISPITFATYDMGTMLGLKGFCAAVLGGLGSGLGSIMGGFLLGILESLAAGLISSAYKDAVAFFILILVLLLRPQGLFGLKEVKKL